MTVMCFTVLRKPSAPPLVLGFIGDSITGGDDASDTAHGMVAVCGVDLSAARGGSSVTVVNAAVSGTASHDWIPSFGHYYSDAVTAFVAAGVQIVHIMLGTNDANTANIDFFGGGSTGAAGAAGYYNTNLGQTVSGLMTAGYKVVVSYPPYIDYTNPGSGAWSAESDLFLQAVQPYIDAMVDNVNVFQGDKTAYTYFQAHPSLLVLGPHPGDVGHAYLGGVDAVAIGAAALALGY